MRALWIAIAAMVAVALAGAADPLSGQQPPPGPPGQEQTELVFEREVFQYPSYPRRNPFRVLLSSDESGPRIEQLRLIGILRSEEDPASSVAVLGMSVVNVSEDGQSLTLEPGPSWYLTVGQRVGNITLVEVHDDRVVVEVEEFGLTERKTMQLETRRLGGTP